MFSLCTHTRTCRHTYIISQPQLNVSAKKKITRATFLMSKTTQTNCKLQAPFFAPIILKNFYLLSRHRYSTAPSRSFYCTYLTFLSFAHRKSMWKFIPLAQACISAHKFIHGSTYVRVESIASDTSTLACACRLHFYAHIRLTCSNRSTNGLMNMCMHQTCMHENAWMYK
jgi:hypothetical protein